MSTGRTPHTTGTPLAQGEAKLMTRVHGTYAGHLIDATKHTSVTPEFLAALTANESGGDPQARRFEPGVYRHLKDVAAGRLAGYGGVTKSLLDKEIAKIKAAAGTDRPP